VLPRPPRARPPAFPTAKIILTVRDADGWYDSVHNTIFRMFGDGPPDELVPQARRTVPGLDVFTEFHRKMIWDGFLAGRFADRSTRSGSSKSTTRRVLADAPADRLLTVSAGAGWAPLCGFLGVPVPDEPYPHLNDPAKFWARVAARVDESRSGH